MPLKCKRSTRGYVVREVGIVDPLSIMDYVFNTVGINIENQKVFDYWSHYQRVNAAWAQCHPGLEKKSMPCGLYGDACRVRPGEKVLGIFLNLPLFRPRSIRCSRFLLIGIQEELMYKRKTLDAILRFVVWRMNLLIVGRWPTCDIDGNLLTRRSDLKRAGQEVVKDMTFAVTELRGDWVYMKEVLSFRSSWKGGSRFPVCFQCEARAVEPNLYYQVHEDSHVWTTIYPTLIDFLVQQMPSDPSF